MYLNLLFSNDYIKTLISNEEEKKKGGGRKNNNNLYKALSEFKVHYSFFLTLLDALIKTVFFYQL